MTAASDDAIVVYGKPGCCLCDDAKPLVDALAAQFGLQVRTANILDDEHFTAAYHFRIPVVAYQGVVLDEGRITAAALRANVQRVMALQAPDRRHAPSR